MVLIFNSTVSREISGINFTSVRLIKIKIKINKKWQWPNSAHITYAWHALLVWHTYLHTYICICNSTVSREISGTNFTSVRLSGNKIARGEAECYLPSAIRNVGGVRPLPFFKRASSFKRSNHWKRHGH